MKKYLWIFFILILIVGIAIFVFDKNDNNKQEDSYTAERTGTNINNNEIQNIESNNNETIDLKQNEKEEKISEYSTRLPKDTKERYSNIKLACETLNGTVVKKGETFSLWNVLGCPTKEKGYKKAKAFTSEGEIIKSYGGGICQISTTIYNAVLEVEGLEVKERHEHSRDVVYIKDGKDAAVSYNSADFKFKNTLDYDVKIGAKVEKNKVKIELFRI